MSIKPARSTGIKTPDWAMAGAATGIERRRQYLPGDDWLEDFHLDDERAGGGLYAVSKGISIFHQISTSRIYPYTPNGQQTVHMNL